MKAQKEETDIFGAGLPATGSFTPTTTMPVHETASPAFFSLGLTGGIGSGKSTVAALFAKCGAGIVDTDDIAHRLTKSGGRAMDVIRHEFGAAYVNDEGALDRAKMRELVFQDPAARKKLEAILHPMIQQDACDQAAKLKTDYIIFVIPLLTEQPVWRVMASRILVVDCSEEDQIRRVIARNGMTREQVRVIMETQATRAERLAIADDVILNESDVENLSVEVARLNAEYKKIAEKWLPDKI